MKARLKNGNIVTGRLAEIFVNQKVATWIEESKEVETISNEEQLQAETIENPIEIIDFEEQVINEEVEAKEKSVVVTEKKAKVSVPKKEVAKKRGRQPKVKK